VVITPERGPPVSSLEPAKSSIDIMNKITNGTVEMKALYPSLGTDLHELLRKYTTTTLAVTGARTTWSPWREQWLGRAMAGIWNCRIYETPTASRRTTFSFLRYEKIDFVKVVAQTPLADVMSKWPPGRKPSSSTYPVWCEQTTSSRWVGTQFLEISRGPERGLENVHSTYTVYGYLACESPDVFHWAAELVPVR
jgi:hypothetical protein